MRWGSLRQTRAGGSDGVESGDPGESESIFSSRHGVKQNELRNVARSTSGAGPNCLGTALSVWQDASVVGSERSSAWLERQLWELDVAGSNPVAPTIFDDGQAC